jgi:hypothetical protein
MKAKFNYSFDHISDPFVKAAAMNAFVAAMREMYLHISEATGFKPGNNMIDVLPMLDKIINTNDALIAEMKQLQNELHAFELKKLATELNAMP